MAGAATAAAGAAAFAPLAGALVPVRYVGPVFAKKDNLLNTKRTWTRGQVLQVPADDARRYFKHPGVWRHGEEPWDAAAEALPLTADQIVEAMRSGNLALLAEREPAIYALIAADPAPAPAAPVVPLQEGDAAALLAHVPALAQALTQVGAVADKLDAVAELLRAYPPLWHGCIAAERAAKGRADILRKLATLAPVDEGPA